MTTRRSSERERLMNRVRRVRGLIVSVESLDGDVTAQMRVAIKNRRTGTEATLTFWGAHENRARVVHLTNTLMAKVGTVATIPLFPNLFLRRT